MVVLKYNLRQATIKYEYLTRLILTIFILVAIPFMISQYFITHRTYEEIKVQNKQHYSESALHFCNYFKDQLSTVNDNAIKISVQKKLVQSKIFSNYWYRIEALEILETYREMIPNAENIAIHFKDTNIVLASDYTFHLDRFIERFSANDKEMKKDLQEIFSAQTDYSIKILTSFDTQMSNNAKLIIAIPIRMSFGIEKNATLMYIISNSSLSSNFFGLSSNESFGLAIFDNTKLIYANKDFDYELKTDNRFQDFICQKDDNFFTYKMNNVSKNIFKKYDEDSGLAFISVVSENTVMQKVITFYGKIQTTMIILMLGIIFVSAFAVYISYKPISDLIKNIQYHLPTTSVSSEIKTIRHTIDKMYSENNEMNEIVSEQRLLLMDYIFGNILYGFPIPKNNKHLLYDFLEDKTFFVINIYDFSPNNLIREQLTQAAFEQLGISIFMLDALYGNYITIICVKNPCDSTEQLSTGFQALLEQTFSRKFVIGVGNAVDDINKIRISYLHALTELEHNMKLILTRQIKNTTQDSSYTNDKIPQFLQCIQNGFESDALAQLSLIFDELINKEQYIFKKNYLCYELISSYVNTMRNMNIIIEEHVFTDLIAFNSSEILQKKLEDNISIVCKIINQRHETVDSHLKKLMIAYIDSSFTEPDITLVKIADEFNLSMYTCSRLFKEFTGTGFKEYITEKRMTLAKDLLLTTNKKVYEISNEIGFDNSTYFMTCFKANFGISPSKFRRQSNA